METLTINTWTTYSKNLSYCQQKLDVKGKRLMLNSD